MLAASLVPREAATLGPAHFRPFLTARWRDGGRDLATGVDCWGLFRAAYHHLTGERLPAWDTVPPDDTSQTNAAVEQDRALWQRMRPGDELPLDLVLLRVPHPTHVGMVAGGRLMLHVQRATGTARLERYDLSPWGPDRVEGFYRYLGPPAAS